MLVWSQVWRSGYPLHPLNTFSLDVFVNQPSTVPAKGIVAQSSPVGIEWEYGDGALELSWQRFLVGRTLDGNVDGGFKLRNKDSVICLWSVVEVVSHNAPRSAVTAPDSSLSTIRRATRTRVSTRTIHRRLKERNLRLYPPLHNLPISAAHCRACLQWCSAQSVWNHADWERIVFSNESSNQLCLDDRRRRVRSHTVQRANPAFTIARQTGPQAEFMYPGLIFLQVNARPHTACVDMNCLKVCLTLPSPAKSPDLSPIKDVWDMMGRRLHLLGNVNDLAQQLEQIWQEKPQEAIRVLYHSMPRRVAACLQERSGSTPYWAHYFLAIKL
ncbi:transposable element Tc1 transposase [Trichonephila clavipes]|nr:transposable element Tc1 transposase [Trichonephila clavipes]